MRHSAMPLSLFVWFLLGSAPTAQPDVLPAARKGPLTTHVLNTTLGKPGAGINVALSRQSADRSWKALGRGRTDKDGRASDLYPLNMPFEIGVYRLEFDTGAYFQSQGIKSFFPRVEIVFQVEKVEEHHHVPLLLSPFGFTTYRGS